MNDARVDAPTPGSSSVEAYEEDWYRSLRALAERRATEFEDLEGEPQEQAGVASPEGVSSETPSAQTADPPATDTGSTAEATAQSPWAAPSLFDRPRPEAPATETPRPDPLGSPTPTVAETRSAGDTTVETESGAAASELDADEDTARSEPPQHNTSPWARVLRPLERLQLSPLDRPTQEKASEDAAPGGSEALKIPTIEARKQAEDALSPAVEPDAQVDDAQRRPETDEADSTFAARPSMPEFIPREMPSLDAGDAAGGPAEETAEAARIEDAGASADDVRIEAAAESSPEAAASAGTARDEEADVARVAATRPPQGLIERDAPSDAVTGVAAPDVEDAFGPRLDVGSYKSESEAPAEPTGEVEIEPEATRAPDATPKAEATLEPDPQREPEPEAEPEPGGPSLTSRDPAERKTALVALEEREPTAAELDTVAALILDPDAEIRRMAVETLSRTPTRLDDAVVRQALQDPADEVRAAAVRAAATRGIRDLPTLAPLIDARHSPETHRTVLELLPKILGEAQLTAEALDPLLLAVAQLKPSVDDDERAAFSEIAASIGTTLLIEGLILPDARRLGAVRLLAGDRSHAVLHALTQRAGDPLEEVRQAGLAAADEIARMESEAGRAAGPPDIGALAEDLRNPDPEHVERALTTLAEVDRSDVVAWGRERLAQGDAESVATVASLAAVLDLNEIGVELLTRGASLPSERRRPVIEALAEFPNPSQLAGFLSVVPSDKRADAVRLVWEASGRRILPDLRTLLADAAVEVRVAVIDIAGDADDPASIEAVAGLLASDASPEVRAAAVRTISKTDGALADIVRALGDQDPHVRATAVESMPSSPASEVGAVLAQALTDLDERVRLAAIDRLAGVSSSEPALAWSALRRCRVEQRDELLNAFVRINPNQVLEIALEYLYSPDQEERKLAVEMTGWGASQAAVESAIGALGDPVPDVRRAAVAALGRLRDRSAVAALGKTLADPDAEVRVGAVRALGVIDDEGVLAFLVAALKDPDDRVRETTSHVLTEWSSPAVAKRLAGVLAVPSLRDSAADLLRRIGPTSVELLIDVLIQGSAEIRPTVGPLLEQIIGIEKFLDRMDSLEPERRLRAIEALGAIAGPLAVDALMRSLSDPDERVRLRATQLLGELGDPSAADAVRRLVDDPVPDVAAAARSALETNLDSRGSERPAEYS
jgi:HEAT repeat protein